MVVSSLAFGTMHYNAYEWNLYQMLITVGLTRILFDWAWYIIFDLLAFLVGAMAG